MPLKFKSITISLARLSWSPVVQAYCVQKWPAPEFGAVDSLFNSGRFFAGCSETIGELTTFSGDTTMMTLEQPHAFAKGGSARFQR
jgi:hypothetical protein